MFSGCKSLKYLNLTNFNSKNIKDSDKMNKMFEGCKSIRKENVICKDQTIQYYFWKNNVF